MQLHTPQSSPNSDPIGQMRARIIAEMKELKDKMEPPEPLMPDEWNWNDGSGGVRHSPTQMAYESAYKLLKSHLQSLEVMSDLVREDYNSWKARFAQQGIDVPDDVMEIFLAREIFTTHASPKERFSENLQNTWEQFDPLNNTDFSIGMFQTRPSLVRTVLFKNDIETSPQIDGLRHKTAAKVDRAVAKQIVRSPETSFTVATNILCQYYKEALAKCQSNRGVPIRYKQGDHFITAYLPIKNGKVQMGGRQYPAERFVFLTACAMYRYKTGEMSLASKDKPEYLFEDNGRQYIDTDKYQDIRLNQIDENILYAWE